jgi:hypothetical protein
VRCEKKKKKKKKEKQEERSEREATVCANATHQQRSKPPS